MVQIRMEMEEVQKEFAPFDDAISKYPRSEDTATSSSRLDDDQRLRSIALKIVPAKEKSIYSCPIQTRAALSPSI